MLRYRKSILRFSSFFYYYFNYLKTVMQLYRRFNLNENLLHFVLIPFDLTQMSSL